MKIAALVLIAALAGGVSAARGAAPEFRANVDTVRWADLRFTYRAGCPVGPPQLRTVEVSYWDFAGKPKVGRIVVARRVADDVGGVFRGEAIDINTVENPYVRGSTIKPPAGRAFLDRSRYRKGMAVRDGVLVRALASVGWKWGASFGDYQHFSTTGR